MRLESGRTYDSDVIGMQIVLWIAGSIIAAIAYALGAWVYGGVSGGLAILLLCVVYALLSVLAVIPFIGVFIQGWVLLNIGWPAVSGTMGIEASWLTTLIFAIYILSGLVYTFVTSALVLSKH